jgi:E3 ubiquitin-protein ligase RNF19A
VRFCPYCKARIEKAEGCNHMTCYYCEFQFCWICGATYTSDHFTALNPMGCGGMQFIGD